MDSYRKLLAIGAVLLAAVAIAACGSSKKTSTTTTSPSSTPSTSAAGVASVEALVPAQVKSKGTLTVAADASYPPDEFFASDGHTVIGWDSDLAKAIGAVMGLKVNVVNVTFASILAGLAAGKYDFSASSFTDTKAREKTVDFVDYFSSGEQFFTKAQGGSDVSTEPELCGHTVAVETGTVEESDAMAQSGKCKQAGKPAVKVLSFPDQNGANLALSSGRAQMGFADSQVADYFVAKSNGQFKLVGAPFGFAPYGLAVPKQPGLAKAIQAALQELIKSGRYSAILSHWNIHAGLVSKAGLNGAKS